MYQDLDPILNLEEHGKIWNKENIYKLFHENKSQLESEVLSYSNLIGLDYFSGIETLKNLRFIQMKFK